MRVTRIYENDIIYIDETIRIEYKSGKLFFISTDSNDGNSDKTISSFNLYKNVKNKIAESMGWSERLLRLEPRYMTRLSENVFLLSNQGKLILLDILRKKEKTVFTYGNGTRNPLYFFEYQKNGNREIVFGDYRGHDKNGNVGIYRYSNQSVVEIANISGDKVDHIHRVEYDDKRNIYWIYTGDTDAGSGIWTMPYNGRKPKPFITGLQQYRACVSFVNEDSILYATDSPMERNHIYSIDINTKNIIKLSNLPGSCIFGGTFISKKNSNIYYCFATAVEPNGNMPMWKYLLNNKPGTGIVDNFAHLIVGNEGNGFKEVWRSKKDVLPMALFQFGNLRFPTQRIAGKIFFCPQGCREKGTFVLEE